MTAAGSVLGVYLERQTLADGSGDEWRIQVTRQGEAGEPVTTPHGEPVGDLWEAADLAGGIDPGPPPAVTARRTPVTTDDTRRPSPRRRSGSAVR